MQAFIGSEALLERRHYNPEKSIIWDKLSLPQKFAARSLLQFGYELAFIRHSRKENLAVFICGTDIATIADGGEINTSPNITIR